ncbi:MAG TPA: COX15/CtaA family protein, partial [Flavobacteriales bacterium]|nr:COX15/CtaA family protein [Flavobacteriales bacterium]
YNTWPLMNGEFMPENVSAFGSLWKDLADHKDGVQFVHRNLAWLVAAAFITYAVRFRKTPCMPWKDLISAVLIQFVLGVITLLTHVEISIGMLHQLGAVLLLTVALKAVRITGRQLASTPA